MVQIHTSDTDLQAQMAAFLALTGEVGKEVNETVEAERHALLVFKDLPILLQTQKALEVFEIKIKGMAMPPKATVDKLANAKAAIELLIANYQKTDEFTLGELVSIMEPVPEPVVVAPPKPKVASDEQKENDRFKAFVNGTTLCQRDGVEVTFQEFAVKLALGVHTRLAGGSSDRVIRAETRDEANEEGAAIALTKLKFDAEAPGFKSRWLETIRLIVAGRRAFYEAHPKKAIPHQVDESEASSALDKRDDTAPKHRNDGSGKTARAKARKGKGARHGDMFKDEMKPAPQMSVEDFEGTKEAPTQ